ncbi:hypothetical protein CYQ88_10440 [Hydrogenovibrio sp. SC-1]|nr:hypothetical protein CYQ88_10440 [Hydrogenovibrio sp. SC-1]
MHTANFIQIFMTKKWIKIFKNADLIYLIKILGFFHITDKSFLPFKERFSPKLWTRHKSDFTFDSYYLTTQNRLLKEGVSRELGFHVFHNLMGSVTRNLNLFNII